MCLFSARLPTIDTIEASYFTLWVLAGLVQRQYTKKLPGQTKSGVEKDDLSSHRFRISFSAKKICKITSSFKRRWLWNIFMLPSWLKLQVSVRNWACHMKTGFGKGTYIGDLYWNATLLLGCFTGFTSAPAGPSIFLWQVVSPIAQLFYPLTPNNKARNKSDISVSFPHTLVQPIKIKALWSYFGHAFHLKVERHRPFLQQKVDGGHLSTQSWLLRDETINIQTDGIVKNSP